MLVSFKAEFRPFEEEIARLSQEVRDEAYLASKQAQKQENELQARERSHARKYREVVSRLRADFQGSKEEETKWRLEINRRKLERTRLEALDTLSSYDYQKAYRQIRKECIPGTSMWICENPKFQSWKSGTLKTLQLTGKRKYEIAPNVLAILKMTISGVGEIGHEVRPFNRFRRKFLLIQTKLMSDCSFNRHRIAA